MTAVIPSPIGLQKSLLPSGTADLCPSRVALLRNLLDLSRLHPAYEWDFIAWAKAESNANFSGLLATSLTVLAKTMTRRHKVGRRGLRGRQHRCLIAVDLVVR